LHLNNRYHTNKLLDNTFHPEPHGGDRNSIFPKELLPIVHTRMVRFLESKPTAIRQDLLDFLCKVQQS
jgi:hypothetical protein